jgi:hypothetical protein
VGFATPQTARYFDIHTSSFWRHDDIAHIIAGERQREPMTEDLRLKPGKILKVYRDPAILYS